MRNFNDIYNELINHPDYVYSEIYTKEDYTTEIAEFLFEEGRIEDINDCEKEAEKIFNENRESITKDIGYFLGNVYEYGSPFEFILQKVDKKYPELDLV